MKYLQIDGVLIGDNISEAKFEKFLEDNNLCYFGELKETAHAELIKIARFLVKELTTYDIDQGLVEAQRIYTWVQNKKDYLDTLSNTGNGNYYSIVAATLGENKYKLFEKYSKRNWAISDEFEVEFYKAMEDKLKEEN